MNVRKRKQFPEIGQRFVWLRTVIAVEVMGSKVSQGDFAESIGVTRTRLASWEQGDSQPTLEAARIIKKRFAVTLDFIFDGDADSLPPALRSRWFEWTQALD
jgi:DNA-binding XRE family transcriptional regulator